MLAIVYCQFYCRKWAELERLVPDRMKLYRDFERLCIEKQKGILSKGGEIEYEKKREIIHYFILRQEFLSPTFMPIMKESCLRDDFNFASYLNKCLYQTITSTLEISLSSLLAFLLFLGFYILLRKFVPESYREASASSGDDYLQTNDSNLEVYIMGGLSLLFFILQSCIKLKCFHIYTQLCHPLKTPYEYTLKPFDAVRNPNTDKVVVPKYLRDNFKSIIYTKTRLVNSHEALFWLASPKFMIRLLHFTLMLQIIWPIIFFSNYTQDLKNSIFPKIICITSSLLILTNIFCIFPRLLRNFSIISNIEMMKNEQI
jgi:hypothetical protein